MNFVLPGGDGSWGGITGTLSNQTDLQNALNARNVSIVVGSPITLTGTNVTFTAPDNAVFGIITPVGMSTNGTSMPLLQLGDAEGYEATGYSSSCYQVANASTGSHNAQTTGFVLTGTANAGTSWNMNCILTRANASSNTFNLSLSGGISIAGAPVSVYGGGTKSLSNTLTGGRFIMANGTDSFDAGYFNTLWVVQNV